MPSQNPIHDAIKKITRPMINERRLTVEGSVQHVDYYENTARIFWRDPLSGAERESADVPLPINGDGVYKQSVKAGDRVTLAFENGSHAKPYITMVHKKARKISHQSKYGADIPKGMGFM